MFKWLSCTRLDADSLIFLCLHVFLRWCAAHRHNAAGKLEWLCPSDWKLSAHLNTFWPQWVDDEGNTDAIICCMLYRSKQCINKTLAFTDTLLYSNAMACVAASCVSTIWMSPDAALFSFYLFFLNQETEMLSVRRETCTNPGVYLFITSSYRPPFRAYRFLTK